MGENSDGERNATLLDRARGAPPGKFRGRPVDDELTDLAIAFVRGEVTSTQAAAVLGGARQSAVQRCFTAFRRAVGAGRVSISDSWAGATPRATIRDRREDEPPLHYRTHGGAR